MTYVLRRYTNRVSCSNYIALAIGPFLGGIATDPFLEAFSPACPGSDDDAKLADPVGTRQGPKFNREICGPVAIPPQAGTIARAI